MITSLSTVLQQDLDDSVRGKVMALWIMGFGGTVPIGGLLGGLISEQRGHHLGDARAAPPSPWRWPRTPQLERDARPVGARFAARRLTVSPRASAAASTLEAGDPAALDQHDVALAERPEPLDHARRGRRRRSTP